MTPAALAYAERMEAVSGSLEEILWQRAELAQQARDSHIPYWAEIAANCPSVKRSPRRVYEWVATVDFRNSLPQRFTLTFSHYDRARRFIDKLDLQTIVDAMSDAEQEGITADDMSTYLSKAVQPDVEDFNLADTLDELYMKASALQETAEALDGRGEQTRERDNEAMLRIMAAVDIERGKLIQAQTVKTLEMAQ